MHEFYNNLNRYRNIFSIFLYWIRKEILLMLFKLRKIIDGKNIHLILTNNIFPYSISIHTI